MADPPKIDSKNADSLLNRIAGKKKLSIPSEPLPPEQEERYARWWEMKLLGASIPEIVKFEKKQNSQDFTARQVGHGLDLYAQIAMDETGRQRRMAQHRAFIDKLRSMAMNQVQTLRKRYIENDEKGIPVETEEQTFDDQGRAVSSRRKVTHEPIDKSLIPWLRFAVDLDKYAATIDGLMGDLDNQSGTSIIDVDVSGFIGLDEDDSERN